MTHVMRFLMGMVFVAAVLLVAELVIVISHIGLWIVAAVLVGVVIVYAAGATFIAVWDRLER